MLGVEGPLWTETVRTMDDIEYLAFPRLAAIAEIGWSPVSTHDWTAFRVRLGGQARAGRRSASTSPVPTMCRGWQSDPMPTLPGRRPLPGRPTRDQTSAAADLRVTTRNARFQQWQALLTNRTKRQRSGEFLVQGVRPITLALQHGWQIRALLYDSDVHLSAWARGVLDTVDTTTVAVAGALMRELGGKTDTGPEILAVVAMPVDDLAQIAIEPNNARRCLRPADESGQHRHAGPVRRRLRRVRRHRHRPCRRPVRPQGGAGQHGLAVLDPGGTGSLAPAGTRLGCCCPRRRYRPTPGGNRRERTSGCGRP